ncbi:unnamed protein product [Camellia sinensis]
MCSTNSTRGKAPIIQHLPGESKKDYADFSSKILHLKGDKEDIEFMKVSLSAEGFDVVYDINETSSSIHGKASWGYAEIHDRLIFRIFIISL